uniref:Protein kinase domain-containing protein n=1 Tax=Monopterus albus TaxID=43700 RepID=A0A3Q3KDL3_MONAL
KTQNSREVQIILSDRKQKNGSGEYVIQAFLGEGSFGKVAKCLNLRNNETVAIKIHKSHLSNDDIEQEVAMLQALRAVDPDKNNLVRFIDSFDCQNCYCLAFEMLDKSLWDLMMDRRLTPLTLNEIRPITQQLLVAFHALKGLGIIHTDLKADNIMLVNHQDQPFKVKLIDFGLALPASKARIGMTMQIRSFRAPEVFLGLPISEAIDMWGLGCVMAFLYFSNYLFSHSSSYKTMKDICQMVGQPEDHLLNAGTKASHYFIKKVDSNNLEWRLMTAVENEHAKNPGDTGDDSEDDCYRRSVAERYRDFNLGGAVKAYMTMEDQPQVQTDVIQDLQLILKDLKGETEVLQKELEAVKSVTATPQDSHQTQPEKDLETERLPFHQEKTSLLEELNNLKNETNILLAALKKNREELKNGQKSRDCMKAQLEEIECQFFQKKKKKLVQMILLS